MPTLLASLPVAQRSAFTEMLKLVVFSHRHNKNDAFLANLAVDFGVVREPMYKYSKVAQERFFEHPTFAFLFAWFSKDKTAREFAEGKFRDNSDAKFAPRMTQEVDLLA